MATEPPPPNPYAAPSAALTDGAADRADAVKAPRAMHRKLSRVAAVALSILSYPLVGAGFYILNRPRRLARWIGTALAVWVLMIVSGRIGLPKLFVAAFAVMVIITVAAIVDTAFARAGAPRTTGRAWLGAIAIVIAAKGGAMAVREWLVEAFQIPSGAMVPTLLVGDHIFAKKGRDSIARGDVIVFEYPRDRSTDYVKRVVALGGDRVEVKRGVPSINGVPLAHADLAGDCPADDKPSFVPPDAAGSCRLVRETNAGHTYTIMLQSDHPAPDFGPMTVPADEVLVFGDNRDNSMDSRYWGGLPLDHIKGTATVTWWSKDPQAGIRWSRIGRALE